MIFKLNVLILTGIYFVCIKSFQILKLVLKLDIQTKCFNINLILIWYHSESLFANSLIKSARSNRVKWGVNFNKPITNKLGQVLKPSENGTSFLEVILNVKEQFYSGGIFVIKWSNF